MSKKSDHKANSEREFLRYSANKMTEKERNAFERSLQKDAFDEEAQEGFALFTEKELKNDFSDLKSRLSGNQRMGNRFSYYRIAAGFAVLVAVSGLFYLMLNRKIMDEQPPVLSSESSKPILKEEALPEPQSEALQIHEPAAQKKDAKKSRTVAISTPPENAANETLDVALLPAVTETIATSDQTPVAFENSQADKSGFSEMQKATSSKPALSTSPENETARLSVQEAPIAFRGRVVSAEDYQPLPGVSVYIKESQTGTITDMEGSFVLPAGEDADSSATLRFAFIGMEEQELLADAGPELNVVLNPAQTSLDEIVVTGYGSKRKSERKDISKENITGYASPVDGYRKFEKYISDNQLFPTTNTGISEAIVSLDFLLDENGRPTHITVVESPAREFSDEAIRLLSAGPDWTQSAQPSQKTRVKITLAKKN